jgi:hypothetical protein
MVKISNLFIGLVFPLLLLNSCNKRYINFSKVNAIQKRGAVVLQIENISPEKISKNFEREIEKYCIKRLAKEGYNCTNKNPKYLLVLTIKVDSSFNHGLAYTGPGVNYYAYSRMSKGIELYMEAKYMQTERVVWEDKYELYYFDDLNRDLSRTKGVIKYMLSGINDENK